MRKALYSGPWANVKRVKTYITDQTSRCLLCFLVVSAIDQVGRRYSHGHWAHDLWCGSPDNESPRSAMRYLNPPGGRERSKPALHPTISATRRFPFPPPPMPAVDALR